MYIAFSIPTKKGGYTLTESNHSKCCFTYLEHAVAMETSL